MENLTLSFLINKAKESHSEDDVDHSGFDIVARVWLQNHVDIENIRRKPQPVDVFIKAFFDGYNKRASRNHPHRMSTKSDPLIGYLAKEHISGITRENVDLIRKAHRYSMGVENVIGALLEEYIHFEVLSFGWAICWGNCIPSVDLCNRQNELIQIKNRTNTENSSSSRVRRESAIQDYRLTIQKWNRQNDKTNKTYWPKLNRMLKLPKGFLTENKFKAFAIRNIRNDRNIISLEEFENGF